MRVVAALNWSGVAGRPRALAVGSPPSQLPLACKHVSPAGSRAARRTADAPKRLVSHRGEQPCPMQDLRRIVVVLVRGDGLCFLDHRHVVIHPFPNRRRRLVDAARAMHFGRQEIPDTYENANLVVVPAVARGRDLRMLHDAPPLSAPQQTPPATRLANPG